MEISRRGFLKLGTILGASSVLPGCAKGPLLAPKEEAPPPLGNEDFAQSVCDQCPTGCGLKVRRVDGRPVGISGAPEHPINQGSLCPKGPALLQDLYHPDRLKTPLVQTGARGRGAWTSVSWEEAIRRISASLSGPSRGRAPFAVLSAGRRWDVDSEALETLAKSHGGGCFTLAFPESDSPVEAYEAMHAGARLLCDPAGARLVVSFGFDWLQTHPQHVLAQKLWGKLRSRGAEPRAHVVQVGPRFSVTAAKSDLWVPVRPATEGFLALGVAREMIESGRYDSAFIRERASGLGAFKKAVQPFTAPRVAEIAGVSEKQVRLLCAKFLSLRPAVAIGRRGAPWSQMAVHALNALSGSLGMEGIFSVEDAQGLDWAAMDLTRPMPEVLLIDRANPVFLAPSSWKQALEKVPLVVTVSAYLTETAELSDIVLPCHTSLERLHASQHRFLDARRVVNAASRAVEPLYKTKDPGEIFRLIGGSSGDFASFREAKIRQWGGGRLAPKEGESGWLELPRTSVPRPGRVDFEALARAIPREVEPPQGPDDKDFPLSLCVFTPLAFSRGEGGHLPFLLSIAGVQTAEMWETWAEIHPETARACKVEDGDRVSLRSRLGKISVKARVLASAMPGVVSVPFGLGHTAYGRWAKSVGANPMEIAEQFEGEKVRLERI